MGSMIRWYSGANGENRRKGRERGDKKGDEKGGGNTEKVRKEEWREEREMSEGSSLKIEPLQAPLISQTGDGGRFGSILLNFNNSSRISKVGFSLWNKKGSPIWSFSLDPPEVDVFGAWLHRIFVTRVHFRLFRRREECLKSIIGNRSGSDLLSHLLWVSNGVA
ncbi:hypothetical protein Tco_0685063 [Tanacetum coccineum]